MITLACLWIFGKVEYLDLEQKMLADLPCLDFEGYLNIFLSIVQKKKKTCSGILSKLVLGFIR
jgi:hypothetical protein